MRVDAAARTTLPHLIAATAIALAAGVAAVYAQAAARVEPPVPAGTAAPASAGADAGLPGAGLGLDDLNAMTFDCPRAALNAAAREAAKVPSQGTYQFAAFAIVNASHHASYEVRFTSNYAGERDLDYCVALYCQQGWDPRTTKASVTLLEPAARAARTVAAHGGNCAHRPPPVRRRSK
jgi:hypothetical protein